MDSFKREVINAIELSNLIIVLEKAADAIDREPRNSQSRKAILKTTLELLIEHKAFISDPEGIALYDNAISFCQTELINSQDA